MSTHEYRVRKRAERAAAKALASDKWTRMCLDAGFTIEEVGSVTVRMLHEKRFGPVQGRSLMKVCGFEEE